MSTHPDRGGGQVSTLTPEECMELLTTTTVGHLAFVDDGAPQLVLVNFALLNGTVYFRTLADGYLSRLARGDHPVAFGVDNHDDVFRRGWNVTIRGTVGQVEDRATINLVLSHTRLNPWAGGVRPMVMRVTIDAIDGRRVALK